MSSTSALPSKLDPRSLYRALDKKSQQFRLLRIHPGQKSQPLKCDLYIAVLKRRMGFEALSYVWGDPDSTTDIIVNRVPFPVRANLHAALHRLRRPDNVRVLWVDAVCINQTDDEEKGHQVNLMNRIYTFAATVVAWLGDVPPQHDPSCVALFNKIRKHKDKLPKPRGTIYYEDYNECMEKLMTSSWFSRVWIIQESVLPHDLRIMLGPADASFQDICDISKDLARLLEKEGIKVRKNHYSRIKDMREKKAYPSGRGVNFLSALVHAWGLEATDPRDMTYALLGTVNDWQGQPPMSADYTVDERQVIIKTAFDVIRRQKSLQFLVPAGLFRNSSFSRPMPPNCPSWVPPFSRGTLEHATEKYNSRPIIKDLQLVDNELLSLNATFLGTVDMCSKACFPDLQASTFLGKHAEEYEKEMFDELAEITEVPRILDYALASEWLVASTKYYDEPSVTCLRQIFDQHGRLIRAAIKRSKFQLLSSEDPGLFAIEFLRAFLHAQLSASQDKLTLNDMDDDAYSAAAIIILKRNMSLWACWSYLDEVNAKDPLPLTPGWWCFSEHIDDTAKLEEGDNMQVWLRGRARRIVRMDKGAALAIAGYAEPGDKIFDLGGQSGLFVLRPNGTRAIKTGTGTRTVTKTVETYMLVEKCLAIAALEDFDGTPTAEKRNKEVVRVYIC